MIDDNFHFMDESERYKDGEYNTYNEAVAKCKEIIDSYLESAIEPGMNAEQLYTSYQMFGEDPFILGDTKSKFYSWDYAQERSAELIKP